MEQVAVVVEDWARGVSAFVLTVGMLFLTRPANPAIR